MLSFDQLLGQLEETLTQLDVMISHIYQQATVWSASPFKMMESSGQPALAPLVIARAQALAAYTSIQVDIRVQERARRQQEEASAAAMARLRGEL